MPPRREPLRLVMMGEPHFVDLLARLLQGADCWIANANLNAKMPALRRWRTSLGYLLFHDIFYVVGGTSQDCLFFRLARLLHKPICMHWIGSDVSQAREHLEAGRASAALLTYCRHWAEVPWIVQELAALGIPARVVPLTSTVFPEEPPPLPEKFTLLAYLPEKRFDFYNGGMILQLAQAFPTVDVLVVGSTVASPWARSLPLPANLHLLGRLAQIDAIYARATALVRITRHDGLSFMVLEALANGRHVIWSQALGPVRVARDLEALKNEVAALIDAHARGALGINLEGIRWVNQEYEPRQTADRLRRELKQALLGQGMPFAGENAGRQMP